MTIKYGGNWKNDAISYCSIETLRLTTNAVGWHDLSPRFGPPALLPPPSTPPPPKEKSPTALPENRHKIDNYLRKVNFFTLWSSPPLWNAWFSCHTTIRCSLVSHPVDGGKLLDRAVISSCSSHAHLKIKFNSYLVDRDFICIQVTLI